MSDNDSDNNSVIDQEGSGKKKAGAPRTLGEAGLSLTDLAIGESHLEIDEEGNITEDFADNLQKPVPLIEFLAEKDAYKALRLWFSHISPLPPETKAEQISVWLNREIALIDELINEQLNQILHHPKLQKLEASWRGLHLLCESATNTSNIKIKILDINWQEVTKDIERAMEFDQSQLFHKIYSEEFGIAGGIPYGVILADYYISHRPSRQHPYDDMETLTGLCHIAAAAFAPLIISPGAEFFGLDSLTDINGTINFEQIFQQSEYIKWRNFRDLEDSRFVGLTFPRVLMRDLYSHHYTGLNGLMFKELAHSPKDYLWGNACYAFGSVLIREFGDVGWFSHIRGVPRDFIGGGLVTHLKPSFFNTDKPGVAPKLLTEAVISDQLERRLSELGMIPVCQCYDTPYVAFHSNQSTQKPKTHSDKEANINAKLSAMLQHVLCASRFAHFIKVMIRDKTGAFITAQEVQNFIERWLQKYTSGSDDGGWDLQARYPLRESEVIVKERPDKPGSFSSVIYLKPHYQLDQMVSELKLTTELAQAT